MGVIIGVIVLLVSIGFVVLMAVSEWSDGKNAATAPSPEPLPAASKKKAARAPKKKARVKKK